MNSTPIRAGELLHGPVASAPASAIDGNIYYRFLFFSTLIFSLRSILIFSLRSMPVILRSTFLRSRAFAFIFLLPAALMMQGRALAQWNVGTNVLSTNSLVGIGTSAPAANLDVRGDISNTGSLFCNGDIFISRTTYGYGYVVRPDVDGYRNLQFACTGGHPLDNLCLNSGVTFTTGRFGINNTLPGSSLDMYFPPDATVKSGILLHTPTFVNGPNAQASYFIKAQDEGTGTFQFIVHGDGATGINTDAVPGYTLSVNGPAIFTKAVVKTDIWADYVFDSAYKLRPLAMVEQYIKVNRHLPDIPSADSITRSGLDLGGNQAALLKKIEELTLYIIAQGNELNEQNKLLQDQSAMLKAQEERIGRLEKLKENAPKK